MKAHDKTTNPNKLGFLYFLDFLVVFLSISVSFWMNEWNSDRKDQRLHQMDVLALLVDLDLDGQSLRDYCEAAAKQVNDNHHLVDDVCMNYYNEAHP